MIGVEGEHASERGLGRRHLAEHHVDVCVQQVSDRDVGRDPQALGNQIGGLFVAALVPVLVGQTEHRRRGPRLDEPGETAPGALEERG